MTMDAAVLQGFAYGEHIDGPPIRSLGYRLLAPAAPQPWTAEVETLARRLHATTYPDPWPPVELFCSLLLEDGQRVIAAARYGLADHTVSRRRGGLELIGVVAPGNMSVACALAVYRWLRRLRAGVEDLRTLGATYLLDDVLREAPPSPPPEPAPVLPIRMWQEGVFLFAATSPADPDNRLGLLGREDGGNWQWLPLCGVDFPLQTYARRGPLVAWTPHLADLAVKLDRKTSEERVPAPRPRRGLAVGLAVLLLVLLGANLWALLTLPGRLAAEKPGATADRSQEPSTKETPNPQEGVKDRAREKFALALYRLAGEEGKQANGGGYSEKQLIERYRRLAKADADLRVDDPKAQALVGLVSELAKYSPEKVARIIQESLGDQEFVKTISERVKARLLAESAAPP
jgi:hypothetical protein